MDNIETSSIQIYDMVNTIIGDSLNEIDTYLDTVRKIFTDNQEVLTQDLDKIILQIPVYVYNLIVLAQQIEMKKGVAKEQAKYVENEALLQSTGTVAEKSAKAENATIKERMVQTAYTTASSIVSRKIEGAMAILDSAKKVQQRRMKELSLTGQAGNAACSF